MDRAEWYDEKDKTQIELLVQQFTSAYERAATHVRQKLAGGLSHELRGMTNALKDVETLLQDTIYRKTLSALKGLGQ